MKDNQVQPMGCGRGCFLAVLVIVGAAIVLIMARPGPKPKSPEEQALIKKDEEDKYCNRDTIMAEIQAEEFVKASLKSPSTAVFPSFFSTDPNSFSRNIGNCTYEVTSWVDAQNSFGAKLRTRWTARVKYLGNDRWAPIKISIQ